MEKKEETPIFEINLSKKKRVVRGRWVIWMDDMDIMARVIEAYAFEGGFS